MSNPPSDYWATLHDRVNSMISWKQRALDAEEQLLQAQKAMIWFREHPYSALPPESHPRDVWRSLLAAKLAVEKAKP